MLTVPFWLLTEAKRAKVVGLPSPSGRLVFPLFFILRSMGPQIERGGARARSKAQWEGGWAQFFISVALCPSHDLQIFFSSSGNTHSGIPKVLHIPGPRGELSYRADPEHIIYQAPKGSCLTGQTQSTPYTRPLRGAVLQAPRATHCLLHSLGEQGERLLTLPSSQPGTSQDTTLLSTLG